MTPPSGHEPRPASPAAQWITRLETQRIVMGLLAIAAVASAVISIFFRHNDFAWHYRIGQGALKGMAYANAEGQPFGEHYPLGRVLINALIALPPYTLSRALVWALGVVCIGVALRAWHRMANVGLPVRREVALSAGLLAVLFTLPIVFRDLDDCGLQLILMALIGLAGMDLAAGRSWRSGLWLALAVTYKTTPLLFLGYLIYKRRWKEPLWMIGFALLFNLAAPALYFGWDATLEAHQKFFNQAAAAMQIKDPSANPVEPSKHQNLGLKPALARYLMTFPPEHPLFIAQKGQKDENQQLLVPVEEIEPAMGFVQFLDLPPETANRVVTGLLLLLAGVLAWRFRRSMGRLDKKTGADTRRDISAEWAAVALLCALLSPLCWSHHMVLLMPSLFLVIRAGLVWPNPWYRDALMWLAIATTIPLRELVGRHVSVIYLSYNAMTVGSLILMGLALTLPRTVEAADRKAGKHGTGPTGKPSAASPGQTGL